MTTRSSLTAILAWVLLSPAAPVRADAVTYWNDVAVTAVTVGRPGGGQGFARSSSRPLDSTGTPG
jgi:hypothetical protein